MQIKRAYPRASIKLSGPLRNFFTEEREQNQQNHESCVSIIMRSSMSVIIGSMQYQTSSNEEEERRSSSSSSSSSQHAVNDAFDRCSRHQPEQISRMMRCRLSPPLKKSVCVARRRSSRPRLDTSAVTLQLQADLGLCPRAPISNRRPASLVFFSASDNPCNKRLRKPDYIECRHLWSAAPGTAWTVRP
jgi:hypothetical protein